MLRDADAREVLIAALREVDQLVLLGDVIELRQGPVREALRAAEPVLAALGGALGPGGRVVVVPGNHDHRLLAGWFERRGRAGAPPPLALDAVVDGWSAGEPLAVIADALAPAAVEVRYPGVWLRPDVYATHGHYLDRHTTVPLFERLGAGAMARIVDDGDHGPREVDSYEAILAPMYAWIHELAQHGGPSLGRSSHGPSRQAWRALEGSRRRTLRTRGMAVGFRVLIAALSRSSLGPLRADISGPELRRAALRAFGEVLARLEVQARHVIFGHTHRAGPLRADEVAEWVTGSGMRLLNTGSWVHEPGHLGTRPAQSPYRAGFCTVLGPEGAPELANLLDAR